MTSTTISVALSATAVVATVVVAAPAAAAPECFGRRATIVGRENQDVHGTNRRDVIVAGTGESAVYARGGNDLVCLGGNGYKRAYGGRGHDRIDAGRGYDFKQLKGGPGNDFLYDAPGGQDTAWFYGGRGDDEIRAGAGPTDPHTENDYLNGGPGDDVLLQGSGRSMIFGGPGNDVTSGGRGFDTVSFGDSTKAVVVNLARKKARGYGRDSVRGFESLAGSNLDDRLLGTKHGEVVEGLGGNDVVVGRRGGDTLVGGDGDDDLRGQKGKDLLGGGAGDDRLGGARGRDTADYYYRSDTAVTVDLASGTGTGAGEGADELVAVENAAARAEGSILSGDGGRNVFFVASGMDMDGRAGSDTVDYLSGTDTITVDLREDEDSRGNVLTDVENVTRRVGEPLVAYGDDAANRFRGGRAGDHIEGRGGDDVLLGRLGDDFLDGGEGHDVINGGPHDTRRGDECVNGEKTRNCEA